MQQQSLKGILSSFFQIGGKLGNKLFSRDSGIDARNSADDSYVPVRAAGADGSDGSMLTTYDDVLGLLPETFQITAVIAVADWVTNIAVKTVSGITTTGLVHVAPAPASNDDWVSAQCLATSQGTDELTFICKSTPTVDITVNIAYTVGA